MEYNGALTEYFQIRAAELGCVDYTLKYRAFKLRSGEKVDIQNGNDVYFIARADAMVVVESQNGLFHRENPEVNEDQIEHSGQLTISSDRSLPDGIALRVEMWQMIPSQCRLRQKPAGQ
jgi:hypothetical protein